MVERTITATIAAHPDCGVAIWGPRRLRDTEGFQATTRRLDDDAEPIDKAAAVALDALASQITEDAAAERARGVNTLVLSEENLMGSMGNNFRSGVFYGDVAQRLAAYDSLLPQSPDRIAMGVRDYGAVWTSAFHYLPQVGKSAPPRETARDTLLDSRRGWPEVVRDVAKIWPDSPMLLWQQEDLEAQTVQICAAITGLDADQVVVPDGKINARKAKTPRPDVFDPEERKHLTHRYNRHLRRLRKTDGVNWAGGQA
ncbi:hypothetical protein Q4555_11250 [Octadecabacter sp. 1_MG-2023]|uniref:hypothetical protein n=1 Tax=unclassified Octadecabacter TaxID=196158 RepID=UPI001C0A29F8|nr:MULTISPECIES: hypothetical protein [unclassified Octadecabacter]MBU2993909.1 hypothetical protein [Octadecabacter sp. B2R22]MDO6735245.1 hypothetical protein [Octadecabacter sp. 1_MG-2023]